MHWLVGTWCRHGFGLRATDRRCRQLPGLGRLLLLLGGPGGCWLLECGSHSRRQGAVGQGCEHRQVELQAAQPQHRQVGVAAPLQGGPVLLHFSVHLHKGSQRRRRQALACLAAASSVAAQKASGGHGRQPPGACGQEAAHSSKQVFG